MKRLIPWFLVAFWMGMFLLCHLGMMCCNNALIPQVIYAAERVYLTRVDSNLYRIDYGSSYVKTRYCHAYSGDALMTYSTIYFDTGEECDIDEVIR